jgi:hypothetical protein
MTQRSLPHTRCFLAYLTANDSQHYQADFLNFRHMARWRPGVERIQIYIAVSEVRPFTSIDRAAIEGLLAIAAACEWLDVRAVFWKGNVGRDFSSAEVCLQAIGQQAQADDLVMVRNRSSYGPSQPDWYRRYADQLERFPTTGLVGSTINLCSHPRRAIPRPWVHVQTYAYLSRWRFLKPLAAAYPGARCTDRLQLIEEGEYGLSKHMLLQGAGLSCLLWPNEYFSEANAVAPHLPQQDLKETARALPLRYRYAGYFLSPRNLPAQHAWWWRLRVRGRAKPRTTRAPLHVVSSTYNAP